MKPERNRKISTGAAGTTIHYKLKNKKKKKENEKKKDKRTAL
jgi:hypothetical protein